MDGVVTLIFLLSLTSSVQLTAGFDAEAVSRQIETSHTCRQKTSPGMIVSVVKDGMTLLSRGYGMTGPKTNIRVTNETRFNVASLTKAFTAALLVKLMDDSKRFSLSTPVGDILGSNFRFEDDLRTQYATVEDILSHKMAIPSNTRMRFNPAVNRRSLPRRVRYLKSYDTFRTTFIYSNIMYGLASRMSEILGKGRWEDLVRRHFLQPLGMHRSTFSTDANLNETHSAKPYILYDGKLEQISFDLPRLYGELVGSGAFITTANDMVHWMNFHLYGGVNAHGQQVMKKESVADLHKPRTAMPTSSMGLFKRPDVPVTTSFDIYALGWWRGYYRGYPIIGHSGASYGFRAFTILVPSLKAGVFVALNGDDKGYVYRGTLLNLILDNLLGVTPWVDTNVLCTFPSPWHNISSPPSPAYNLWRPLAHNVSAYLGVYEHPAYGQLEIRLANNRQNRRVSQKNLTPLRLLIVYGFGRWELVPLRPKYAALNAQVSSRTEFPEYFYGVGKGVTAFIDFSPFIFQPPSTGSDVIEEISVPGFESRLPPVFKRVTPTTNKSHSLSMKSIDSLGHFLMLLILSITLVSR